MRLGHNVVGRPGHPRRADRNIQMPAHAAGERSNVTISKDPQESELPAPDDFSTRVLKWSGAGSALSCRPLGKSQKASKTRSRGGSCNIGLRRCVLARASNVMIEFYNAYLVAGRLAGWLAGWLADFEPTCHSELISEQKNTNESRSRGWMRNIRLRRCVLGGAMSVTTHAITWVRDRARPPKRTMRSCDETTSSRGTAASSAPVGARGHEPKL